jgi:alkaline phosphatase
MSALSGKFTPVIVVGDQRSRSPRSKMPRSTSRLLDQDDDNLSETSSTTSSPDTHTHWFRRLTSRRSIIPFFLTLLCTLILILALTFLTTIDTPPKRNLVLMVSDGMGPASLSLTRSFMQFTQNYEFSKQLPLDEYFIGTSRTRAHGPSFCVEEGTNDQTA